MKQITPDELEELKNRYKANRDNMSEEQRAAFENEIWEGLKYIHGAGLSKSGFERRDWFHRTFGEGPATYEARASLYNAGVAAKPIWEKIQNGRISLSTARNLLRAARKLSPDVPLTDAVQQVLKHHEDGVVSDTPSRAPPSFDEAATNPKLFHKRVQDLSVAYLNSALADVDEYIAHQVKEEFSWAINDALTSMTKRIAKLKSEAKRSKLATIQKSRFENACMRLGISCRWKQGLDAALVRKRAKARKFELHPDRNQDLDTANEFQAVRESEELLLEYAKLYPPKPGEGNGKKKKKSKEPTSQNDES